MSKSKEIIDAVDNICRSHDLEASSHLIPVLQEIQERMGFLPREALLRVSEKTGSSLSQIYGVATFYHRFRLRPEGRHLIQVCRGTACHVSGTFQLYNLLLDELGIVPPDDTTSDGLFTVQEVRCIGACSLAPVIKIDDQVYGKCTTERLRKLLNKYREGQG